MRNRQRFGIMQKAFSCFTCLAMVTSMIPTPALAEAQTDVDATIEPQSENEETPIDSADDGAQMNIIPMATDEEDIVATEPEEEPASEDKSPATANEAPLEVEEESETLSDLLESGEKKLATEEDCEAALQTQDSVQYIEGAAYHWGISIDYIYSASYLLHEWKPIEDPIHKVLDIACWSVEGAPIGFIPEGKNTYIYAERYFDEYYPLWVKGTDGKTYLFGVNCPDPYGKDEKPSIDMSKSVDYLNLEGTTEYREAGQWKSIFDVEDASTDAVLEDGNWYVTDGQKVFENCVRVDGDVNLILRTWSTLRAKNGIFIPKGSKLTIWAQTTNNVEEKIGRLMANPASGSNPRTGPAIGGVSDTAAGELVINGGIIDADGGIGGGAAIGSGPNANMDSITINGGVVRANAKDTNGAAIGGGNKGKCSNITINGGTVTAVSFGDAAAIGAGYGYNGDEGNAYNGTIKITGGTVNASSNRGAAIGSSKNSTFGGTIEISGGTVWAYAQAAESGSTYSGAAIGGGMYTYGLFDSDGRDMTGTITISGGDIHAQSEAGGAGIGAGYCSNMTNGKVYISGGKVEAKGGNVSDGNKGAAGIGGGVEGTFECGGEGGYVEISGGTVDARAGSSNGCAIGSGQNDSTRGAVSVYDGLKVYQTDSDGKATHTFTSVERNDACQWRAYVHIEKCDHKDHNGETRYAYTDCDDDQHTKQCQFCVHTETEEHSYGPNGKCVCGHGTETTPVTLTFITCTTMGGDYTDKTVEVRQGNPYELPEPENVPEHYMFMGWSTTKRDTNDASYDASETIYKAGDSYDVGTEAVTFYARYAGILTVRYNRVDHKTNSSSNSDSWVEDVPFIETYTLQSYKDLFGEDVPGGRELSHWTIENMDGTYQTGNTINLESFKTDGNPYGTIKLTAHLVEKAETNPEFTLAVYSRSIFDSASVANVTVSKKGPYTEPTEVTVSAPATEGYAFVGWFKVTSVADGLAEEYQSESESDVLSTDLRYTFTVSEDTAIAAVYEELDFNTTELVVNPDNGAEFYVDDEGDEDGNPYDSGFIMNVDVGSQVTIRSANPTKVLEWRNSNEKLLGSGPALTLTIVGYTEILLTYKENNEGLSYVKFMSDYGQVLSYGAYSKDDLEELEWPTPPSKVGYTFAGWTFDDGTDDQVTKDTIKSRLGTKDHTVTITPLYEKKVDEESAKIEMRYYNKINGQIARTKYITGVPVGSTYTLTAPTIDGYKFIRWENDKSAELAYTESYYTQVMGDTTLVARYLPKDEEPDATYTAKPIIRLDKPVAIDANGTHKVSCSATRSIPDGWELVEHGMLYACGEADGKGKATAFEYDGEDVLKAISTNTATSGVVRVNVAVETDDTIYATFRGYMILRNEETGEIEKYYSGFVSACYEDLVQV